MLEIYCRTDMWNICHNLTGDAPKQPLCWLKNEQKPAITAWEYEGFYDGGMSSFPYIWMDKYERKRGRNDTFRYAVGIFARNGDLLFRAYLKEKYKGDLRAAILDSTNFDDLYDRFVYWFQKRKEKFMDKTAELIKQLNPGIKNVRNLQPNSHGGVANLLRVLTKTMNAQGSSIRTIAKVQYTVCLQAGIYVPEEFMNDVLTAADIDPNVFMDHDERMMKEVLGKDE